MPNVSSSQKIGYQALPAHDEEEDVPNDGEQAYIANAQSLPALTNERKQRKIYGRGSTKEPVVDKTIRHSHRRAISDHGQRIAHQISDIDVKLKEWTATVRRRFHKSRQRRVRDSTRPYEIIASAYAPAEPRPSRNKGDQHLLIKTLDHSAPMTEVHFLTVIEEVKVAIRIGVHPRLNKAGSSGSYFAKTSDGKTRAIFKPKNEEPYGSLNPKWSKWFHRHFLAPFVGFGRACLLPNFSYLSEAGASILSDRLQLHIVPYTSLVSLSSPSFFYDWLDRHAYKQKKRPLPDKIGSFQLFLDGYKDASEFLRDHPWPGRAPRDTLDLDGLRSRRRKKRKDFTRRFRLLCGAAGVDDGSDDESDDYGSEHDGIQGGTSMTSESEPSPFIWTRELMLDFRLELEKLVILDVLMRNTDRGLDNFMIKVCQGSCPAHSFSASAASKEVVEDEAIKRKQPTAHEGFLLSSINSLEDDRPYDLRPHVHIAAIDNSLSFPIHHPNSWRSYCYGWLFLPSSLIGQPFSRETREHFLPILTDPIWMAHTVFALRQLFSKDDKDFNEKMFSKQIAVLKGQAWNIVMSLRIAEEGPLELCRRTARVVYDDEVVVADDDFTKELIEATATPVVRVGGNAFTTPDRSASPYRPSMDRNRSIDTTARTEPKPRMSRHSTDRPHSTRRSLVYTHPDVHKRVAPRPLPVSKHVDLTRSTFGNATGVSMMEHMDRLQKQEEDVAHSLGVTLPTDLDDDDVDGDEEEDEDLLFSGNGDVYDHSHSSPSGPTFGNASRTKRQGVSLDLPRNAPIDSMPSGRSRSCSTDDIIATVGRSSLPGFKRSSVRNLGPMSTKVVIAERMVEVDARPYFVRC